MKEVLKLILFMIVVAISTVGWLALADWIFIHKRAEYCDRIDVSQSFLTKEGKARQFYACKF